MHSVIYDVYYGCALADPGKTRGREIFTGQTLFKKKVFWKMYWIFVDFYMKLKGSRVFNTSRIIGVQQQQHK